MNIPGFIAEASLYRKSGYYESVASQSYGSKKQAIIPQRPACDSVESDIEYAANRYGECLLLGSSACAKDAVAHLNVAMQLYSLLGC